MQLSGQNKCVQCAKVVIKNEGLIALYRSLPITMIMNAPYHVTTVVINENMKKIVKPKERKYKFLAYFYCAGIAGSVSSILTCPLDNIKTKLQTQSTKSSCDILDNKAITNKSIDNNICGENINKNDPIKYHNIKETIIKVYREDGFIKGFYRGATARMLFNSPSCAISWCSYEFMKHMLTDMKFDFKI